MRAHKLKLCMPSLPKRLPGIHKNSRNCNYRILDEVNF